MNAVETLSVPVAQFLIDDLRDFLTPVDKTISIEYPIANAMQLYKRRRKPYLVITENDDTSVIGVLREDTLLEYCYDKLRETTGKTNSRYFLACTNLTTFRQDTSPVLRVSESVDRIFYYIRYTKFSIFPVVDEQGKLLGTIGCRELIDAFSSGHFSPDNITL